MKKLIDKILESGVDASNDELLNIQIRSLNRISLYVIITLLLSSFTTVYLLPEHQLFAGSVFFIELLILTSVLALTNVQRITLAKMIFAFNTTFVVLLLEGYYGIPSNFHFLGVIGYISLLFLYRNGSKTDFLAVVANLLAFLVGTAFFYFTDSPVIALEGEELKSIRFVAFVSGLFVVVLIGSALFRNSRVVNLTINQSLLSLSAQARILQTISSNVDEAFFKSNPSVGFEFMNESFARIYGYASIEEMMLIHPEKLYYSREDRVMLIDKLRRERAVHNVLIRYVKKDGTMFFGRLSCNMIIEQGQDRIVGVITDVTQQHRQDELLRQNELRLKEAQRIAKLGNFQLSEATMLMSWSEETFRVHGYPHSEVAPQMGELVTRFTHLDLDDFKTYFEGCKLTGIPTEFGGWYIDPLGTRKFLQFRARYVDLESADSYWMGTVQDITDRKEMEEELEGTTRFYENILNKAPLEIALLDKDFRYVFISEEAVRNKEVRNWIIGKTDFDYCKHRNHPITMAEQRTAYYKQALESQSVVRWEDQMNDQYGRKNFMFRNIAPIKDPIDGSDYLVGFAFNVTRLRESQINLEIKNEELIKLNQELDRFVYSISHDLRAPIASVLGLISLAEESENINQARDILSMQREALDRLDIYIRDVIDYSRNKRLEPKAEQLNISKLVSDSLGNLAYLPGIEQIEFFFEYEKGDDVVSDQMRVQIVLNNLISNAIKYVDSQKEHSFIRVATERKNSGLNIIVQDNGIGINPLYVERIWEMFYRGTSESSGSGLGLYILKESLKNIAGEVNLETEFGKGTTFTVFIPDLE